MATLRQNCGHSGFCFLPIARGKDCYPSHGKKNNQKLPYLLAHGHRLPNFTSKPRAITGKELCYICTLSAFSVGAGILFSRSYVANGWSNRGQAGAAPRRNHSHAHNTRDGCSSLRMPRWRLCSMLPVRSAIPSQDEYRWERKWGFPSSLNSVIAFALPEVEKSRSVVGRENTTPKASERSL